MREADLSLRFMAGIFLLIGAIFAIDKALARWNQDVRQATAAGLYEEARTLSKAGDYGASVERYRSALALSRNNKDYRLGMIWALAKAGRLEEAAENASDFLRVDPANGMANLAMARVLMNEGKSEDAVYYYHRSIYGQWPQGTSQYWVRFELADLLKRMGKRRELLAETLPLEAETSDDPASQMRIASLLLAAGSAARAVDVYHHVLASDPKNVNAVLGLGKAQFAAGNYREAQAAFLNAYRLKPGDTKTREQMQLASEVMGLDPLQRRLGPSEREERSRLLLKRVEERGRRCAAIQDSDYPEPESNTDVNVNTAEQIWNRLTAAACEKPDNDALSLVMAKLTSQ